MRESFIIAEITVFIVGLNYLILGVRGKGLVFLFLGSYGLLSTKNYLWTCMMVALLLSCIVYVFRGINRRKNIEILLAGSMFPVIVFASTTSIYSISFIFQSNISATGQRSGDSISEVYVEVPGSGTIKQLITFHGEFTLVALYTNLQENPNSFASQVLRTIHLDKKIQSLWDEKIALGLVHKDNQVGSDTSSPNGHILITKWAHPRTWKD